MRDYPNRRKISDRSVPGVAVASKAKEKYEQEKAERVEQEYEQEHRARYGGPAREPPAKPAAPSVSAMLTMESS